MRFRNIVKLLVVQFVLLGTLASYAAPFTKGSHALSVIVGSGSSFNDDYIILGGGYGYYLVDGLEVGLDAQAWLSGDPSITKISPQIKYVFTQPKSVKPYVGVFFRRTYIDGLEDLDSTGYRAGLYFMPQKNFYFGGGVAVENYSDCSESVYTDCSTSYPEILFSFSM